MFEVTNRRTTARTAFQLMELIFFWTARAISGGKRNALVGFLKDMAQSVLMIVAFFLLFTALGMRGGAPLRGDMIMFLASGIFLFLTHTKTVSAVMGAEGPNSPLMKHSPMNTMVAIIAAALAKLYMQVVTIIVLLCMYHLFTGKVHIEYPMAALGMLIFAWFSGVCVGMVFLAVSLVLPGAAGLMRTAYQRMNMVFSGKMTPANSLSASMLPVFDWNPLFHIIDQARGYVFLNYKANFTNLSYPMTVCLVLLVIGLMGEFWGRQNASISKTAMRD